MNSNFDKQFEKDQKRFNFFFNAVFGLIMIKVVIVLIVIGYILVKGPAVVEKLLEIGTNLSTK